MRLDILTGPRIRVSVADADRFPSILTNFDRPDASLLSRPPTVLAVGSDASAKVAEKVGATFEGTLRSRLFLHGAARDAHMYSVTGSMS